jgi:hypothetical protein
MSTRFLILFFLLIFGRLNAQTLSTLFIDTVKIVVDGKIIYASNVTSLKFVPNNVVSSLTLFNDGVHKLILNFGHTKSKNLNSVSALSGEKFYINDSSCISSLNSYSKYEACSEMNIHHITLKDWDYDSLHISDKYKIRLAYRLCSFAPIDTTNYIYNYREGLWIGPDRGVEKVTVNYKNDKKQGVAIAYYDNGTTYKVNFHNNIANNYGLGHWENYKSKMAYPIPNIVTCSCDSIKTFSHESFYFSKNSILKEVGKHKDLIIHYEKRGILHDSIQYKARGEFMYLNNDTITIKTSDIEVHDFYRKNSETLHDFYKKTESGYSKIHIKDISKIYYERDTWKQIALQTTLISILTGAVISPLISIKKNGFNHERFRNVSLTSLGVMTLSVSFGIAFSQKRYLLKPTKKSSKIWKIEYDAYE